MSDGRGWLAVQRVPGAERGAAAETLGRQRGQVLALVGLREDEGSTRMLLGSGLGTGH